MKGRVLIIEDNEDLAFVLAGMIRDEGGEPLCAARGEEGLELLRSNIVDLVFLDIILPDANGIELIPLIREIRPGCEVVVLTGMNDAKVAVAALKAGAADYLVKPFENIEFRAVLKKMLAASRAARMATGRDGHPGADLVGESPEMSRVREEIVTAARVRVPVLVSGATGTGKEVVARAIHAHGQGGPFVKVDCGTLASGVIESELFGYEKGAFTDARADKSGLVEMADGGTLFLDEIGNLPVGLQPVLLRLIEESTFRKVGGIRDIRVSLRLIAATNIDLEAEVAAGRFRADLFYRLNVLRIELPPLAERGEDVILLADYFRRRFSREMRIDSKGFSPEAEKRLRSHSWPGNIRELKNCVERAVIYGRGRLLTPAHLGLPDPDMDPAALDADGREARMTLAEVEMAHIRRVLAEVGNNKSQAARILGISRSTLQKKLSRPS